MLAPVERLKLKALRLNLVAAKACLPAARGEAIIHYLPPRRPPAHAEFDARFRSLVAQSVAMQTENRALLSEMHHQAALTKLLCKTLRQAMEHSRQGRMQMSGARLEKTVEASALG